MRRKWLNAMLLAALLLSSALPALAQDVPDGPPLPEETDGPHYQFLPSFATGSSEVTISIDEAATVEEAAAAGVEAASAPVQSVAADAIPAADAAASAEVGPRAGARVSPQLAGATGRVQIVIRLSSPSVAERAAAAGIADVGASAAAQAEAGAAAVSQQDSLLGWLYAKDPSAKVIYRLQAALNAVIVEVDAAQIEAIAAQPGVVSVNPVVDYQLDLSETVPHIGAAAAHAAGITGAGVEVAVLDSGIDYLHANLGGSGDPAEHAANNPTVIEPGTFPTAKVIRGYDFVGETWPSGTLAPDPDPLDAGIAAGHGTHVADIIAGNLVSGTVTHKGVAPDALLWAIKVCSSVSTSCSGVALLAGVDFAIDPNNDNNVSDRADVLNLSLGSSYGQREDDLSLALANAVKAGAVVVASAGNSGDRPYIVGSPSSTPELISVAQTTVPSDRLYRIDVAGTAAEDGVGMLWQQWSAEPVAVTGVLQYGAANGTNRDACAAYAPGSLANTILLVDRGTCAISIKVSNGAAGGAESVIIANNVAQGPGEPPPGFSYGGGDPSTPGYTVTRVDGALLKTLLGRQAAIDPATAALIPNTVVASSSRGPTHSYNTIKPDIGAPGGSLSAEYGTGTGETPFSGTSGAAPMVAGSAALVLSKYPNASPLEVKARLMNTADTNLFINPVARPGYLAPISRIGAGEVEVDDAINTSIVAWDLESGTPSLSFGYRAATRDFFALRYVKVTNYANSSRTLNINSSFRYADDAASGAVRIVTPSRITVPGRSWRLFVVYLGVDADKLPNWTLNGGELGGDGFRLQDVEFDGYLTLSDSRGSIHLPWQILPRKSAQVVASATSSHTKKNDSIKLTNTGVAQGSVDFYALLGESKRIPKSELPGVGDNFAVVDLRAVGARIVNVAGDQSLQVAITTYGERAHPAYPAEFDVYIDVNGGAPDYVAFTLESGGFAVSGQVLVYVANLATGVATPYYYADADLNSANMVMTIPLTAIGATANTQLTLDVYAFDNYFTGFETDAIEGMVFTPGTPRYGPLGTINNLASNTSLTFKPAALPGGAAASPSQTGLLLLYRNQAPGFEATVVNVK